jgi:PAS fold
MQDTPPNALVQGKSLILGKGEMAALTRLKDWSNSSIGNIAEWPRCLINNLNNILSSGFPMFIFWGKDLLCFYNDAYRPSLGNNGKHPAILGMPGAEAWPEIWHIIRPYIDKVLIQGEAVFLEDQLVPIFRNGHIEDVYWTFSYSAIYDEKNAITGVLVTCVETTQKILSLQKLIESKTELKTAMTELKLLLSNRQPTALLV